MNKNSLQQRRRRSNPRSDGLLECPL